MQEPMMVDYTLQEPGMPEPILDLEDLEIDKRYYIEINSIQRRRYMGTFRGITLINHINYDEDYDPPIHYLFKDVYSYIGGRFRNIERNITITQEQVDSGLAHVYKKVSDDIYYANYLRRHLPQQGNEHLRLHTLDFLRGGVKSKKSFMKKSKKTKSKKVRRLYRKHTRV
jgi:hypothetical protein